AGRIEGDRLPDLELHVAVGEDVARFDLVTLAVERLHDRAAPHAAEVLALEGVLGDRLVAVPDRLVLVAGGPRVGQLLVGLEGRAVGEPPVAVPAGRGKGGDEKQLFHSARLFVPIMRVIPSSGVASKTDTSCPGSRGNLEAYRRSAGHGF